MIQHKILQELRGVFLYMKENDIKPNFSELARKYGIDRHTVKKYWDQGGVMPVNVEHHSKLDSYFDEIKEKAESVNATKKSIYLYFRDKYGDEVFTSYSTFAHYLQRKEIEKKVDMKVHLRYETPAGHQLQVDWKEGLKMRLKNGYVIEYNLFAATFGYSRYHYLIYTRGKTTEDFLRCLILVLKKAGGIPEMIITDNMSAIVSVNGGRKNKLPVIKQFEKDIGIKIHLCKVRTPQTKGKVESANRFENWLEPYNDELKSEEELLKEIEKLNIKMNQQVNGTTGLPPVKLMAKEMEHLRPIPNKVLIESYVSDVSVQTVPPTLLIRYKGSEYSVPSKFIGKKVKIIPSTDKLYIYSNTELAAIHDITAKRFNYDPDHYLEGLIQSMPDSVGEDEIQKRAKENLAYLDQYEGIE